MHIPFQSRLIFYIFGLLAILAIAIGFFWHPIVTQLAAFTLRSYCHYGLHLSFSTEEVYFRDGHFIFKNPSLSAPFASEPCFQGSAAELQIGLQFLPFQRLATIDIALASPQIQISSLEELAKPFAAKKSLPIKVDTSASFTDGILVFKNPSTKTESRFAFEGNRGEDKGDVLFTSQNQGTLSYSYEGLESHLSCTSLPLADFHQALKFLGISSLSLHIHQGVVNGTVSIEWEEDEEDFPDVSGSLQVKECIFTNQAGDLHGYIPEASLELDDPSLAGEFHLSKGAYLEYTQEGKMPISLDQLEGKFSLLAYDRCLIQARGLCTHHANVFTLAIDGHIEVPGEEKGTCDLKLSLSNDNQAPIHLCVSSYREGSGHSQCTLNVQNIGADEWDLLMAALGTQDIGLDPYTLRNGLIDARIILDLENFKVHKIHIEEFMARHLAFDLDQSAVSIRVDSAHGNLSLDLLAPNVLESLEASVGIEGGMIRFPALNNQQWLLSNLVTKLAIEKGAFKKSSIEADFMGLRGLIEVDWASDKAMNLRFDGLVRDLATLASSQVQKGILKKFSSERLSIVADVWRIRNGLNIEGAIEINAPGDGPVETIQLGVLLEKTSHRSCLLSQSAALFSQRLGADVLKALVKQMIKATDDPAAEWIKEELRIAGFALKNGWFSAMHLPTEKYIDPLLFKDDQMAVSGLADFEGRFNPDGLTIEYQGSNLLLENDDLSFEIGEVGLNQPAMHYFDFTNGTDHGLIPISNGAYFEKNSGLLFVDVQGAMLLKDKKIHIQALETKCNNVFFAGTIDLDYSSPQKKVFDVAVKTHTMKGSYSDVRGLLSHFNQAISSVELPLEGDISLSSPGGAFNLGFRPTGCIVTGDVQGKLQNGKLDLPIAGLTAEDVAFAFDYHYESDKLNIDHVTGALHLKDKQHSGLVLQGGYIHFEDLLEGLATFDVAIQENARELFRLRGKTQKPLEEQGDFLQFIIDEEGTHYAGVHPDKIKIAINKGSEIDAFELQWNCNLATWFPDIHKIGALALDIYAPRLAKRWKDCQSPSGNLAVSLKYDNPSQQFNFQLKGDDVCVGETHFNHFIFAGAKKRHVWSIEQLQMDQIAIAADIVPQEEGCKVNFLGLRYGDMLLMGIEGFYHTKTAVFEGPINLMEIDFAQFGQWKSFHELVNDYHPKGEMKGSGSFRITLKDEGPPHVGVNLKAMVRNSELRGLHFEDIDDVTCEFVFQEKLVFRNCQSGFKCREESYTAGLFGVENASYDFKKEALTLNGLHFHAHASHLDWVATRLAGVFPEAITPEIAALIRNIKEEEDLRGSMDLYISDDAINVAMRLPQGKYKLGVKEHEVKNFVLEWDKKALQIVCQYRFQNTLYWVTAKSTSPTLDAGDIFVSAYPPGHGDHTPPREGLNIGWYMHPQHGMVVEKADGRLPGVAVNLARDRQYPMNPHSWHLDGNIVLDPLVGEHIIPPDLVEALASWKISHNYRLQGKWIFMLEPPYEGELYFQGQLTGKDVILKGYLISSVSADLNCSPTQIDVRNLVFQDPAGRLSIEASSMVKQPDGNWWVHIPRVAGERFRPCLLRDVAAPTSPVKPLVIPSFEINHIVCRADDLSTMTGEGKLTFNNSSKKPLHNPLLAIPAEIISRIGLNLDVLNPVSGTIFFEIEDYKVRLTKFKDVYSQGKLSKFYLPHNKYSYVDLDSNVYAQVRMKQYNLLFKLAELFTVTIHGSLQKPIYTLQKQ